MKGVEVFFGFKEMSASCFHLQRCMQSSLTFSTPNWFIDLMVEIVSHWHTISINFWKDWNFRLNFDFASPGTEPNVVTSRKVVAIAASA